MQRIGGSGNQNLHRAVLEREAQRTANPHGPAGPSSSSEPTQSQNPLTAHLSSRKRKAPADSGEQTTNDGSGYASNPAQNATRRRLNTTPFSGASSALAERGSSSTHRPAAPTSYAEPQMTEGEQLFHALEGLGMDLTPFADMFLPPMPHAQTPAAPRQPAVANDTAEASRTSRQTTAAPAHTPAAGAPSTLDPLYHELEATGMDMSPFESLFLEPATPARTAPPSTHRAAGNEIAHAGRQGATSAVQTPAAGTPSRDIEELTGWMNKYSYAKTWPLVETWKTALSANGGFPDSVPKYEQRFIHEGQSYVGSAYFRSRRDGSEKLDEVQISKLINGNHPSFVTGFKSPMEPRDF